MDFYYIIVSPQTGMWVLYGGGKHLRVCSIRSLGGRSAHSRALKEGRWGGSEDSAWSIDSGSISFGLIFRGIVTCIFLSYLETFLPALPCEGDGGVCHPTTVGTRVKPGGQGEARGCSKHSVIKKKRILMQLKKEIKINAQMVLPWRVQWLRLCAPNAGAQV